MDLIELETEHIYDKIVEISDIQLQRKLWLNQNNDLGLISSFVELMCSLFDDFHFDDFIDKTASEIGLSNSIIVELNKLRSYLNNYDEKKYSDEEIINDSEWLKVVEQAKEVLKIWKK
ncbi:hypothetical protein SDC9_19157 [bioreactor metagenome]|uniref:Uncharacterized protein n=1 Tax=bioreactor metagenome TaxID=1076179 RepID=A0A644U274_9ZZZZ